MVLKICLLVWGFAFVLLAFAVWQIVGIFSCVDVGALWRSGDHGILWLGIRVFLGEFDDRV